MRVAIIGLPKSGKSTVFTAVTGHEIDTYAPPEPHQAIVHIPDERLAFLADLYHPKKVSEATMEFVDIPGCSLEDASGQEEWRKLLPSVRPADLLLVVLRDFESDAVPTYKDRVDPKADFEEMWQELIFADLYSVTSRIERLEKALKKPTGTHDAEKHELGLLERCREALESEAPLSSALHSEDDHKQVASFAFLTEKPLACVRNVSDDKIAQSGGIEMEHVEDTVVLSAAIEAEIAQLDPVDRPAFLADLGLECPARDRLIKTCQHAAGIITFLTRNEQEARAWTIAAGSTAVEAAGKVHTDFARGFIRAETVSFEELKSCGDMKAAKAAGKVRKEGKSYVVQDGDILNILASV